MALRDRLQRPWPWAVAAVVLLVPSVRVLGTAAGRLSDWLLQNLPAVMDGPTAALGSGWLVAYGVLNGSLAADIGVVLQDAGVLTMVGLFLLVLGARMGASAIVLVMEALSRLRRNDPVEEERTSLGVLSFVVTLSVYAPIAILLLGVLAIDGDLAVLAAGGTDVASGRPFLDAGLLFLVGLVGLWISLVLLDAAVKRAPFELLRNRIEPWLAGPWRAVAVGLLVTAATASVAFSIGALVPLYRRGLLTRTQMIPYILGANIGTFSDSLVVAAVLGAWDALAVLAVLMGVVAAATVVVLLTYRWYGPAVNAIQTRILGSRAVFGVTLGLLIVVPVGLVLL